jgi:hypothetical protein
VSPTAATTGSGPYDRLFRTLRRLGPETSDRGELTALHIGDINLALLLGLPTHFRLSSG